MKRRTFWVIALLILILIALSFLGCGGGAGGAGGSADPTDSPTVEPTSPTYNIDNTLSDEAQRTTISFDGLAFLTGNLGADTFLPPGKIADLFGFQFLRDNDPDEMGHNTDFLTKISNNVLYVLTESQVQEMIDLAEGQVDSINQRCLQNLNDTANWTERCAGITLWLFQKSTAA